jgi:hypothetical protein
MKMNMQGTWSSNSHKIKVKLAVILFNEDNVTIEYCPALDISGYGQSEQEAHESFSFSLAEYFLYTTHKKTLREDLVTRGWKLHRSKSKPMTPPSMQDLLQSNENFSRIFNNFDFEKRHTEIEIPA